MSNYPSTIPTWEGSRFRHYPPSAYDSSMSVYEELVMIREYLNQLIVHFNGNLEWSNENFKRIYKQIDDMIKEIERFEGDVINVIMPESLTGILNEWFDNGKLAEIINEQVFNMKADKVDLDKVAQNFVLEPVNEGAKQGPQILNAEGWTSEGWTGDFTVGFTNTAGNTKPLSRSVNAQLGKFYQVTLTVETSDPINPPGWYTITIGGSQPFETYRGGGSTMVYNWGIKSLGSADMVITPLSGFKGTIKNLSVKEITVPTKPTMAIKAKDVDENVLEIRPTRQNNRSLYIGDGAGQMNTTGDDNISLGDHTMNENTSGYWNVALGTNVLQHNTVGSRNIGIGRVALQTNITGHRNVGIGTFALTANTHGHNNIGVGADALIKNTEGVGNVAVGTISLEANTTGQFNVALGYETLKRNTTGEYNIAIGRTSLDRNITGKNSIALGKQAGERVNADDNIAIGQLALNWGTTVAGDIAIGAESQRYAKSGGNLSVGYKTLGNLDTGADNVVFGKLAGENLAKGDRNILIGNNAGRGSLKAEFNRNVIIGHNAGTSIETGADNNIIVGSSSGVPLTTGARNVILGYGVTVPTPTTNDYMNLGGVITGLIDKKLVGIGVTNPTAQLNIKGGTNLPNTAPIKFNAGAVMTTPEAGAFEYDGNDLWLTNGVGVRKKVQLV